MDLQGGEIVGELGQGGGGGIPSCFAGERGGADAGSLHPGLLSVVFCDRSHGCCCES